MDKVSKWRANLTNAANISGWDSQVIRPESKLVDEIVNHILKKLSYASNGDSKGLVGMDSRVGQVKDLLDFNFPGIHVIGIWGMGGVGKTTIAGELFNKISKEYEGCCFLANVREGSKRCNGLDLLYDEVVSQILEEKNQYTRTSRGRSTFIKERIRRNKSLVVFDDVDDVCQLEFLTDGLDLFGPGSRIIVTSRDKQVLRRYSYEIFEVGVLNDHDALHLFSLHAFGKSQPPEDRMELSIRAINYAKGNPLALKVLGSFLYGRMKQEWGSALDKLDRFPLPKVHDVLRVSFDALDKEEKSIFLDVACFFIGQRIDYAKRILDGCGFSTDIGISVLVDKCLITISENKLGMHDLLQQMAHEIINQESNQELGNRSRLWHFMDVHEVLTKNLGSAKVEGIFLDLGQPERREMELSSTAFSRMYNLRLLKIYKSEVGDNCKMLLPHGLESLSSKLSYLQWDEYPLRSLPSNFHPGYLVELNLSSSNVKQLWKGNQNLVNLKEINLSNCEHLTAIPDLSQARNLERMNLQFCRSLVEVPSSIRYLCKISDLDLRHCTKLMSLPCGIYLTTLKTLNLCGCSNLRKCPEIKGSITYLNLSETNIKELPQSIGLLDKLIALNLKDCKRLGNLPDNIRLLVRLAILDICGCSNITSFPNMPENITYLYLGGTAVGELPSCISRFTYFAEVSRNIRELNLDGTAVIELPSSISHMSALVELHLQNCKRFEILPCSICKLSSLQKVNLSGCSRFQNFPMVRETMESLRYLYLDGTAIRILPQQILKVLKRLSCLDCRNCKRLMRIEYFLHSLEKAVPLKFLRQLFLSGCNLLQVPVRLSCLVSLVSLDLSGTNFQTLPNSMKELCHLQYLSLRDCFMLMSLPELPPSLIKLDAHCCTSLVTVSCSSTVVEGNIFEFLFTNCFNLNEISCHNIITYGLMKIQLYTRRPYNEIAPVPTRASSLCFPGRRIPNWFEHQRQGFSIIIQLPTNWADDEFLGFALCVVVAFGHSFYSSSGFQVKCIYHFKNNDGYGDGDDIHCNFGGWYGWEHKQFVSHDTLFMGYDECFHAAKDDWFGEYNEVVIEFYAEDMNNIPLPCCKVIKCGVNLLYAQNDKYCDFIMPQPNDPLPVILNLIRHGDDKETEIQMQRLRDGDDMQRMRAKIQRMGDVEIEMQMLRAEVQSVPDERRLRRLMEGDGMLRMRRYEMLLQRLGERGGVQKMRAEVEQRIQILSDLWRVRAKEKALREGDDVQIMKAEIYKREMEQRMQILGEIWRMREEKDEAGDDMKRIRGEMKQRIKILGDIRRMGAEIDRAVERLRDVPRMRHEIKGMEIYQKTGILRDIKRMGAEVVRAEGRLIDGNERHKIIKEFRAAIERAETGAVISKWLEIIKSLDKDISFMASDVDTDGVFFEIRRMTYEIDEAMKTLGYLIG